MIKNRIYSILKTIAICCLMISCAEDLGNYDYSDINEIQFSGIEEEYLGLLGEPFEIIPTLNFTKDTGNDESRYTYEWIALRQGYVLPGDRRKDLATTKNLQLDALTIPPAEYEVKYRVTDSETGVQWTTSFELKVESTIYEGLLALSDVNGKARLDMLSYYNDTFNPIYDVLDYTGSSLSLEGAPVNVYCYDYDPQFYGIYVTTEDTGTTKIEPDTFDWQLDYYLSFEMLSSVPTDFKADFIERISGSESLMYKDGNVYYYLRIYQYRYGVPINILDGEAVTFKAAPFIGVGGISGTNLLYDEDNKRFVRQPWASQKCSEMPAGTLFDYNTGKDLIYMARSDYNGGEVFAILKDPTDDKMYLARMSSPNFGSVNQSYYEEIPSTIAADMAQADHFTVNPDFGYIFYNVGGKVYEYDFGIKQSKLMIDKGAEEVTLLKFQERSPFSKMLLVASYDQGSANGAIEFYEVPPVNGDLQLISPSFEGLGKVVSTSYRWR